MRIAASSLSRQFRAYRKQRGDNPGRKAEYVRRGPAGTGKTYLAVGFALQQLLSGTYKRIILTRPVVEAGEKLGFLPGDFIEKISPYLKPLYDSIFDIVGPKTYEYLQKAGK